MEPDETRPYLIDGWLMLPNTATSFAAMVSANDVHYVRRQYISDDAWDGDTREECAIVIVNYGGGDTQCLITDVEFFDEICAMVRDAKGE